MDAGLLLWMLVLYLLVGAQGRAEMVKFKRRHIHDAPESCKEIPQGQHASNHVVWQNIFRVWTGENERRKQKRISEERRAHPREKVSSAK